MATRKRAPIPATDAEAKAPSLRWVLAQLQRTAGAPPKPVSTDPFELIVYEQVAYLVPEARRRAAYRKLQKEVGLAPLAIAQATDAALRAVTTAGGSIAPHLRAERLRQSAELVLKKWNGELRTALALPLAAARRALIAFPMIGSPGADRILAATGAHAVLGLDSNALRVCVRLGWGIDRPAYSATYRSVMEALAPQMPAKTVALADASALLRRHGETLCRRSAPSCGECPLRSRCPSAAGRPRLG